MKKLRIIAVLLVSIMMFGSLSALAATEIESKDKSYYMTEEDFSVEDDAGDKYMTDARIKAVNALLKKYGWQEVEKWQGFVTDEREYEIAKIYGGDQREEKNAASQKIGLSGYKEKQTGLLYANSTTLVFLEDEENSFKFSLNFTIIMDTLQNDKIVGAYINLLYNSSYNARNYLPLNTSQKTLTIYCNNYYKTKVAKPLDETAALDFLPGIRVSDAQNDAFTELYADAGWTDIKFRVYSSDWTQESQYLNKEEGEKVLDLSVEGGIISKEVREIYGVTDNGYTPDMYSIHRYRMKGYETLFYVMFCADRENVIGGVDVPSKKDFYAAYIIAMPGIPNSEGKLDRFFYPANASMKDIQNDMLSYYQENKAG